MKRREALKTICTLTGATVALPAMTAAAAKPSKTHTLGAPSQQESITPNRPITAIVLGAGGRGNVYAGYANRYPGEMRIVGVAEPIPYRNERMAKTHDIAKDNRFVTWEHVFERPKFADAVIITTPDHLHYGPAMQALEMGYDLLLEKAIAQSWQECKDILDLAKRKGRIVAVCHVLRYTHYFRQMKHVIDTGHIGDVVSVAHFEPVGNIHMSHSFVRGNWSNTKKSNPMLLSKSCHDTDILRWLIGKPCTRVSSFGSLRLFRKEMAPEGAPLRCTDGCPAEASCPYSARQIYLRDKGWLGHLKAADHSEASILKALKEGPYGRCVYHCDNDVVDHQVSNFEFEDGITAAFSMEGLTSYSRRRTRVMGTQGDIVGDEQTLDVANFVSGERHQWSVKRHAPKNTNGSGHGGGDWGLAHDFVQAVSRQDPTLLTSTIDASMESHLMGFKAEESRLTGKTLAVNLDG